MGPRADITGIDKLIKHLSSYEFCRVEVKRGVDTIFVKLGENNEATEALTDELKSWAEDILENDPDNSILYRISLSGKSNPESKGSGSKFLTLNFRFNSPSANYQNNKETKGDVYLELGELRATNQQLSRENDMLQERIEELEALLDDSEEPEETDMLSGIIEEFKPHIPGLLSGLIGKFLTPQENAPLQPIGNIYNMEEIINKLKQHDPQLEAHLQKLLTIAETNPQQFKMLLNMLGT